MVVKGVELREEEVFVVMQIINCWFFFVVVEDGGVGIELDGFGVVNLGKEKSKLFVVVVMGVVSKG